MKRAGLLALTSIVLFTSCVTRTIVVIDSNVEGAEVHLDYQKIGETPLTIELSNAIWEEYRIRLRADGYRELYGSLRKEIKTLNLISGILLIWPALLWVYGPEPYQYFDMTPE